MLPTKKIRALMGHSGSVHAVRFTPDGKFCLSACADRKVRLWNPFREDPSNPNTALLIKAYEGPHAHAVLDVVATADNSRFASVGEDKTAFMWDVSTGAVNRRLQGHNSRINTCDINETGQVLMTGSYDKTVCLWDLRAHGRDPIQRLTDMRDSVTAVTHTRTEIVVSSVDGCVRTYDLRKAQLHTDELHDPVTHVTLTHDKNCVLCVCLGGMLRLLELGSGELLRDYTGHVHGEYKVECAVANTDAHIIAGSEDGKVFMWGLVSGSVTNILDAHRRSVSSVMYHPSEAFMLTSSFDGTAYLWGPES